MAITLYRRDGCRGCELVAETLEAVGVPFERVDVDRRHSERDAVRSLTGQRRIPAIVDDDYGVSMNGRSRIVEYLETTYGEADEDRPG